MIKRLNRDALALGACMSIDHLDYRQLSELLFTPQGREFCEKNKFPSLEAFQEMKPNITKDMGVFIDYGSIRRTNDINIALIGNTSAELEISDPNIVHKVILMHGAKAVINAKNYTVLLVVKIGNCKLVINKDETVKVL